MINTYQNLFRMAGSYYDMPSRIEDLFIGATRQHTGNTHINSYVVFGLMKSLSVITTEAVYVRLNSRRNSSEHVSQDMAQQCARACRNVISVD